MRHLTRLALLFLSWCVAGGCGHSLTKVSAPESARAPERCGEDEVREYFCDDLLPLYAARAAPPPYESCPATSDVRPGNFPAIGNIAEFDLEHTAYTRRRVQPGHSCCYGWCARIETTDASLAAPVDCPGTAGLREGFCMRELESGTSAPAAKPFERCPIALEPPDVVAFAAPASARLDVAQTTRRRQETLLADCCYGWCSSMPSGTVLQVNQKSGNPRR